MGCYFHGRELFKCGIRLLSKSSLLFFKFLRMVGCAPQEPLIKIREAWGVVFMVVTMRAGSHFVGNARSRQTMLWSRCF